MKLMTLDSNLALFMQINEGKQRKCHPEPEQWASPRNRCFWKL